MEVSFSLSEDRPERLEEEEAEHGERGSQRGKEQDPLLWGDWRSIVAVTKIGNPGWEQLGKAVHFGHDVQLNITTRGQLGVRCGTGDIRDVETANTEDWTLGSR